jgi:predicted transcriptional regulator
MKLNLGTDVKPHMVKINAKLEISKVLEVEQLLKEFKDVFAWTCKDLKGIPPELTQHIIELDITIPLAHQAKYILNPNYATTIKQDIDKLLVVGFIEYVEKLHGCHP